jgi:fused signal recognition particle receptor
MVLGFLKRKIKETFKVIKKQEKIEKPKEKEKKIPKKEKASIKERIIKKVTEKELSDKEFDQFFDALELNLLQSNIAYETIQAIRESLETDLIGKSIKRGTHEKSIINALGKALKEVLKTSDSLELLKKIKLSKEPVSIMFVGTNGSGKTTTISKIANWLKKNKLSVVLAACDTFRAASIEQLEKHGNALKVKVIKHKYGADSAAVAYDAIAHAKAKGVKAVLIDTAGRSHANMNLMNELEKVARVVKPDYTVFVGDSLTGNDVVDQCRTFNNITPFDFAVLTKTDVDEKGGAILSVSHTTGVPIMFLGTGQLYKDLKQFDKNELIKQILG